MSVSSSRPLYSKTLGWDRSFLQYANEMKPQTNCKQYLGLRTLTALGILNQQPSHPENGPCIDPLLIKSGTLLRAGIDVSLPNSERYTSQLKVKASTFSALHGTERWDKPPRQQLWGVCHLSILCRPYGLPSLCKFATLSPHADVPRLQLTFSSSNRMLKTVRPILSRRSCETLTSYSVQSLKTHL